MLSLACASPIASPPFFCAVRLLHHLRPKKAKYACKIPAQKTCPWYPPLFRPGLPSSRVPPRAVATVPQMRRYAPRIQGHRRNPSGRTEAVPGTGRHRRFAPSMRLTFRFCCVGLLVSILRPINQARCPLLVLLGLLESWRAQNFPNRITHGADSLIAARKRKIFINNFRILVTHSKMDCFSHPQKSAIIILCTPSIASSHPYNVAALRPSAS
jgi:hypothetical protein